MSYGSMTIAVVTSGMNKLFLLLALAFSVAVPGKTKYGKDADRMVLHARHGLPDVFRKLKQGGPLTIAYLGGSITAAPGYRVQTEQWLRKQYPQSRIKAINAGVGGTGSDLGVFRLQDDVLKYNPDLVFIEFAVNDGGMDSLTLGKSIEGIIRQIKKHNTGTDICFLYTVSEPMVKDLQQGNMVRSVRYTERIAEYYGLPSINLSWDVLKLLDKDALVFRGQKGQDYGSRTVFTYDGVHPSVDGHKVYTATISKAFQEMEKSGGQATKLPAPLFAGCYEQTAVFSPTQFVKTNGWKNAKENTDLRSFATALPDMIYSTAAGDSLTVKFSGPVIGVQDIIGPTSGAVLISVDKKPPVRKLRFDKYGGNYRRHYFILDSLGEGPHTVVFKPDPAPISKFRLVRPATPADSVRYKENAFYIGKIMLVGKLQQ
jgi:lysophospholipase L1-like esterase